MDRIRKVLHPCMFWLRVLGSLLPVIALVAALALLFGLYLGYMTDQLWGFLGLDSARLSASSKLAALFGIFLFAESLYRFKRDSQKWYGAVEIAFALGFAWRVLSSQLIADRYQNAIALLAAVYLLSRGIANYIDGGGRIRLAPRAFEEWAARKPSGHNAEM